MANGTLGTEFKRDTWYTFSLFVKVCTHLFQMYPSSNSRLTFVLVLQAAFDVLYHFLILSFLFYPLYGGKLIYLPLYFKDERPIAQWLKTSVLEKYDRCISLMGDFVNLDSFHFRLVLYYHQFTTCHPIELTFCVRIQRTLRFI